MLKWPNLLKKKKKKGIGLTHGQLWIYTESVGHQNFYFILLYIYILKKQEIKALF
jgi:hypothetical protein